LSRLKLKALFGPPLARLFHYKFKRDKTFRDVLEPLFPTLNYVQTQCGDYDIGSPISPTTEPLTMVTPPENTVAVVVDISKHGGRIEFFNDTNFVGDIGAEDYKSLVMVP
jgi:hypothetical protein